MMIEYPTLHYILKSKTMDKEMREQINKVKNCKHFTKFIINSDII